MDATELRARTTWGLISAASDPYASTIASTLGPEDSLGLVLAPGSLERVAARVKHATGGLTVPLHYLASYRDRCDSDRRDRALALSREAGLTAISTGHPWWPPQLRDLGASAPLTLWVSGELQDFVACHAVAVVGSMVPSAPGRSGTIRIVDQALSLGLAVVSGGSRGVASDAHRRAVRGGGVSVAVLSGGLEYPYPEGNSSLFRALTTRGALVSEVPCTVPPSPEGLLWRNRLIAALGHGTVVAQAEYRCGAISVGYHSASLGRTVAVVPGAWGDTRFEGCWRLHRECGAMVLTEPADIALVMPQFTTSRDQRPDDFV